MTNLSIIDIFLLGMCISIGPISFGWNVALVTHFHEYLIDMVLSTILYVCLVLCVAEMMSALPFSGNIYELARVALSPYIGFLVGLLETFKNVFHIICCVQPLTTDDRPIYWIIILGSAAIISIIGGRFFWNFTRLMGLACMTMILMYLYTPMINKTDFYHYALTNIYYQKVDRFNYNRMFKYAPVGCWAYLGIELIPFTCIFTKKATKYIPYAMILTLVVLIIFTFGIYFAACSQFPGATRLGFVFLPLMFGYADMLGMTYENACWLSLLCIYASVFAFMFGCGRQISSLSSSGLLPAFLTWKTMYFQTPFMSVIVTVIIVLITLSIVHFSLNDDISILFFNCLVGSYISYIFVFITYIQFKKKYLTLKREFTSPLGNYGAIIGILLTLLLTSCMFDLTSVGTKVAAAPVTIGIVLGLGTFYYFAFASILKAIQYYSEEEQKAFLIIYVINSNNRGRKKNLKKNNTKNNFMFFPSILKLRMNSDSSLSQNTTGRKFLSFLTSPRHKATVIHQDDISQASKELNSFRFLNLNNNNNSNIQNTNNEEQITTNNNTTENKKNHKNSIDFTHLPSLETLQHIREEIETNNNPSGFVEKQNLGLDYLPHTNINKIIPVQFEVDKDLEENISRET